MRFVRRRKRGQVRQDQHVLEPAQGVADQTHLVRLCRPSSFIESRGRALRDVTYRLTVKAFFNANVLRVSITAGARGGGRVEGRGELGEISRGRRAANGSLDRRRAGQGVPALVRSHQSRQIIVDR